MDPDAGAAGVSSRKLPLLAPWWRLLDDGDRMMFEHAGRVVELRGRAVRALLPALLPLLDGTHAPADIVGLLGAAAEPSVRNALGVLDAKGLLTEGPGVEGDAAAEYVAAACSGISPFEASAKVAGSRAFVHGTSTTAAEIARLLEASGVTVTRSRTEVHDAPGLELVVSAPTPSETDALPAVNAERLADGTPWLVVAPYDGRMTMVGPLYVPGQTACHACFLVRRGATSGYETDFSLLESRPVAAAMPEAGAVIAAGLATLVALRWLGAKDPTLPGVGYAFEANGVPTLTRHRVLRVPRCTACGPGGPPPNPWFKELAVNDARHTVHAGR